MKRNAKNAVFRDETNNVAVYALSRVNLHIFCKIRWCKRFDKYHVWFHQVLKMMCVCGMYCICIVHINDCILFSCALNTKFLHAEVSE